MKANQGAFALAQLGSGFVLVVGGADPLHVFGLVCAAKHQGCFVINLPAWACATHRAGGRAWVLPHEARALGFVARQGVGAGSAQAQQQCCQHSAHHASSALRCLTAAGDLTGARCLAPQALQALCREFIRHRL